MLHDDSRPDRRAAPSRPTASSSTVLRRRWRAALAALTFIALVAPAMTARATSPTLTVTPAIVAPGGGVTVAGSGFPGHVWGQLTLDGSPDGLPKFHTDDAGTFSVTATIAGSAPEGVHTVAAVEDGPSPAFDPTAPVLATASISVALPSASATPSPTASATSSPAATPSPTPTSTATSTPAPTAAAGIDHVFVVVEENRSYGEVVGQAPYLDSLIAQGALATNYYAITHPSLPNYLALTGGSTFGIGSDCGPTDCPVQARNLGDTLEAAGRTWKSYHESMPSPCYLSDSGAYRAHHNPFVYFDDVRTNATRCASHDVPYTQLASDLAADATTPSLSLIVPNNCNDMHDCSVGTGDGWLSNELPKIFASPAWTSGRSLLVVTFDEDDGSAGNHVATVFVGPNARSGYQSGTRYDHYSLLRTIENVLGAQTLTTNDGGATPMRDLLK